MDKVALIRGASNHADVILSEFCRIVKKVLKENKGKLSLVHIGENHGTCEETWKQHGRIPRYRRNGMYEKCGLTHGTLVRYADDTVIICKNKKVQIMH